MSAVISWRNRAEAPGASLAVSTEALGLGARSLLTETIGDVWRSAVGSTAEHRFTVDLGASAPLRLLAMAAPRTGILPGPGATMRWQLGAPGWFPDPKGLATDTAAGALIGPATTRIGPGNPEPAQGAATAYTNGAGSAYVAQTHAGGMRLRVGAGVSYILQAWVRRSNGGTTTGAAIIADYPDATGVLMRSTVPMSAVAQGIGWQLLSLPFTAPRSGDLTVYLVADTGPFSYELGPAVLYALPAYDSGALPLDLRRGVAGLLMPGGTSAGVVSLVVTGASGDPYLQLGRLWVGDALVTGRAVSYGWTRGAFDAGSADRAPLSGVSNAQPGATGRTLEFDLPLLTGAEAAVLDDAALAAGTTRQVFVAPFAGLAHGFFGKFTAPPAPAQPRHALFSARISIQEDL